MDNGNEPRRSAGALSRGMTRVAKAPSAVDAAGVLIAILIPLFIDDYLLRVMAQGWLYAALAIGVVVSYGYCGLANMSQVALFGIGAYLSANLMIHTGLPFVLVMVLSAIGTGIAGGLHGSIGLRVRGTYWWLITIAFAEVMNLVFASWTPVTGGVAGLANIPVADVLGLSIASNTSYYYLAFGIALLSFAISARWTRSRMGVAASAVRADETTARGIGVASGAFKIVGFTVAGVTAGLAGAGMVAITGYIDATTFSVSFGVSILLFAVAGGLRSLRGAVLASLVLTYVTTNFGSVANYQNFIFGGAVLAMLFLRLYAPSGTLGMRRWRRGPGA